MCRIYGQFGLSKLRKLARQLAAALQFAGGPDDQSHVSGIIDHDGENCYYLLGINRLAIVDPNRGDQPYREEDSDCIAIFNGEIYNHSRIRETLNQYHLIDDCDGRVILPLYEELGLDFASRLDGMFAIAIVDPHLERLVLATDRIGIKPLYYHWNEAQQTLSFASEIPALLELSGCPRVLRPEGVDAYLTGRAVYGEHTLFEGIFRLPPGSVMVVEPGRKPCVRPYGTVNDCLVMPSGDFDADAKLLLQLLDEEVRSLLIADVPVATMNSGGLDSSIVTALAARHHPGIHSFHIKYRGKWPSDESAYAQQLATAVGTTHHEIVADPADFPAMLGDVAWSVGANADPIALSSKFLFKAVKRTGFEAILTGDGSDELFGGYGRLVDATSDRTDHWVSRYVDSLAAVPGALRERLYTADFRHHLRRTGFASDRLGQRVRDLVRRHHGDRLAGLLEFEQTDRLPAYHLARVDTTSMAHGVEARVPFLQGRIVRFASRLASDHKITAQGVKRILFRAAEGLLPEAILRRPKQPFTLPVAAMLAEGQPLYDYAREMLAPDVVRRRGFFQPQAIDELIRQHCARPTNETGLAIWSLLTLEAFAAEHGIG